jgi:hypothetical protein
MFKNKVLRRICRPKTEEVIRGWIKVHNEELCNLYSSLNIIRVIKSWTVRWVGHVICMEEMRTAYRILIEKPERKRSLGRPR